MTISADSQQKPTMCCPYCGSHTLALALEPVEFERIMARNPPSRALAVGEISLFGDCAKAQAEQWLDHLLNCCRSWPFSPDDAKLAAMLDQAFGDVDRPAVFCDPLHCDECADHNATLMARTTINIRREDLGVQGWEPISFTDPQGKAYLFPALARYALMPVNDYTSQLASHLGRGASARDFYAWCNQDQRAAVYALLQRLYDSQDASFEYSSDADHMFAAIDLWSGTNATS